MGRFGEGKEFAGAANEYINKAYAIRRCRKGLAMIVSMLKMWV
jgi:hypothetical protein